MEQEKVGRWSPSISPMFTRHVLKKIEMEMSFGKDKLLKLLERGAYAFVIRNGLYQHPQEKEDLLVVVYDGILAKPFLLVLEKGYCGWEAIALYSTYEFHKRKYGVVVKPQVIGFAISVYRRYLLEQRYLERVLEREHKKKIFYTLELVITHRKSNTGTTARFFKHISEITEEDYKRYSSFKDFLLSEMTKIEEFCIPPFSAVEFILRKNSKRREIIESFPLRERLW